MRRLSWKKYLFDDTLPYKRSRRWEKEHQGHKAVYRGVDPKLAWKVKVLAGRLGMPVGEAARVLIQYGLHSFERGELDLLPRLDDDHRRRTLVPEGGSKSNGNGWRVVTTWRNFPTGLKQEVAALASVDGLNVPLGELVSALLRFGLQAYEVGLLKLEPGLNDAEETPRDGWST